MPVEPNQSKIELPNGRHNLGTRIRKSINEKSSKIYRCPRPDKTRHAINPLLIEKFSLPGRKPLMSSMLIKRDEIVLPCRLFLKKQEREKFEKQLRIDIHEKYKIVSTDLKKRLHVNIVPSNIKSITDVDESFFDFVNGRQIIQYSTYFKTDKCHLNNHLRINFEISLKDDCILRIETDQINEQKIYNKSEQHCLEQLRLFDTFISEDYHKSIFDLEKWEKLQEKLRNKIHELEGLATQSFTIMSRLIGFEYKYSIKQMYGRFLYYLSPPLWRANHRDFAKSVEIETDGFDYGMSNEGDTFTILFEKLKNEVVYNPIKPALYFEHPKDLVDVFKGIENQQLNHFAYVAHESPYIHDLKQSLNSLREKISLDTTFEQSMIEGIQGQIKFYEENCNILQTKFFRVLNGLFYESVGAPEVFTLKCHLEFCYRIVFGETLLNADIVSLAKGLEDFYFDYRNKLDTIHGERVQQAVKKSFSQEQLKMKQAYAAQTELRLFYRLEKELKGAFAQIENKEPVQRSMLRSSTNRNNSIRSFRTRSVNKRRITETEEEYLRLFTNWTENEDPAKYLHSFINDDNSLKVRT